ncbi:MAG: hypothetical protein WCH77_12915 [Planctomycetota bacterium]
MSQTNVTAPSLPLAPLEYERQYMDKLTNVLRLYFNQLDTPGPLAGASINLNINTLPTQADLANLRVGDVYRDTSASNALKIKV